MRAIPEYRYLSIRFLEIAMGIYYSEDPSRQKSLHAYFTQFEDVIASGVLSIEHDSIFPFAARLGLTPYLKELCPSDVLESGSLIPSALEWWDFGIPNGFEMRIGTPEAWRTETLLLLLNRLASTRNAALVHMYFDLHQAVINRWRSNQNRNRKSKHVAVACFLTTAYLVRDILGEQYFNIDYGQSEAIEDLLDDRFSYEGDPYEHRRRLGRDLQALEHHRTGT